MERRESKITVIDSVMGSGKTSAVIKEINQNPEKKYIYVTPYLTEVERVLKETFRRLREPIQFGQGKLESLHDLLCEGKDVVTTHALFLRMTEETIALIEEGEYHLVLDEALNVVSAYNDVIDDTGKWLNEDDVSYLLGKESISIDEKENVTWIDGDYGEFKFSEVQRLANDETLRCIDQRTLIWECPKSFFAAFTEIMILTYMFEGSVLSSYLRMNGFEYEKKSVCQIEGEYSIVDYSEEYTKKEQFRKLISIYEGPFNDIGSKSYAFSGNWLAKMKDTTKKQLHKHMRTFRDQKKAKSEMIMWTTTKESKEKLSIPGFKYIRKLTNKDTALTERELRRLECFVSCNARATNDFSDRTCLLYLYNRYLNPEIEKYFSKRGYPLDENVFAISELLQWIWRSAIRNGKPIQVYIPSKRMRALLYDWLDVDFRKVELEQIEKRAKREVREKSSLVAWK